MTSEMSEERLKEIERELDCGLLPFAWDRKLAQDRMLLAEVRRLRGKLAKGCQCICHEYPQHQSLQNSLEALQYANDKLTRLPADWFQDSSLKTWFPFTYEELTRLRERVRELEIMCNLKS